MAERSTEDRQQPDAATHSHDTTIPMSHDAYDAYIERMRQEQYPMLKSTLFLDSAGSSLPSKRLLAAVHASLMSSMYGNPHSGSTAGLKSSHMIDKARTDLLRFFGANPDIFDLVFTANATAAIKLVGEGLRDSDSGFSYAYHIDAHTSLVGLRELATDQQSINTEEELATWRKTKSRAVKLFAYPAQSNMSGKRLPLAWCQDLNYHSTYTLLDAAALATTTTLNIDSIQPDFTVVSLYKIFGYPDLGALIVKKSAGHILQRRKYFGGGTVDMVVCGDGATHARRSTSLHEQLEDGTLPVHNIAAIEPALDSLQELYGGLKRILEHTLMLTRQLHHDLSALQHANNTPVCEIYSTAADPDHAERQGSTIAFNLKNDKGEHISISEVEKLASLRDIQLRTGSLCNPGGTAIALGLTAQDLMANYKAGYRCGGSNAIMNGGPTGVIRVSLGPFNTRNDVNQLIAFIQEFFVTQTLPIRTSPAPGVQEQLIVESLTIYPIKSCAGWSVPYDKPWQVCDEGLAWDREWCIVNIATGKALSQKQFPRMALIRPEIDLITQVMRIGFVGLSQKLEVPLASTNDMQRCPTRVCDDTVSLYRYTTATISETLSAFLSTQCTLARFPAARSGAPSSRHSKQHLRKNGKGPTTLLLSNESPILTITRSSLDAVNEALKARGHRAVHHSSFRANIILAEPPSTRPGTCRPWSEDSWQSMQLRQPDGTGSLVLEALGGCQRCQMVCVDQQSGDKRPEVFLSLAKQRRIDGKVLFGIHCTPGVGGEGKIRVGDLVDVS